MKVVTCIGYHGTGSSAVDDLFREMDNFAEGPYEYEARFLQDPDGVRDLEYNLIENPHRLNSGYALKRFKIYASKTSRMYKKIFGEEWMKLVSEYIESLTTCKYKGYWIRDILLFSDIKRFIYYVRRAVSKYGPKCVRKPHYYNYYPNMDFYHSFITPDQFYENTKTFTGKLFDKCNKENKEYLFMDQMVPTSGISYYFNYVKNLKVIIVDRDPRDIYINHAKGKDHVLPYDAYDFCKVFVDLRKDRYKELGDNVLYIYFEDLLYKYDETVDKILRFIGSDSSHHVNKGQFLKVDVSKRNTKMWINHPEYNETISIITQQLSEYLYPYRELEKE
jgi:hypothetical protein